MLDPDSLRRLRGHGMTIGAHTVAHPILAELDVARARAEIHDSRDCLVEILREPVRLFAYPNGRPGRDYGTEHVSMVEAAGIRIGRQHGSVDRAARDESLRVAAFHAMGQDEMALCGAAGPCPNVWLRVNG